MSSRLFISCAGCEEYLYWVTEIDGCFYKYDVRSQIAYYIEFDKSEKKNDGYYSAAILLEDDGIIYGVLNGGEFLFEYYTNSNTCRMISLNIAKDAIHAYCDVVKHDNRIYILPFIKSMIIAIDLKNGEVEYIRIPDECREKEGGSFAIIKKENRNHLVCCSGDNYFYLYSIENRHFERKTLPDEIRGISFICVKETYYYFATRCGDIYKWCITTNDYTKLYSNQDLPNDSEPYFSCLEVVGDVLWAFPSGGGQIISIKDGFPRLFQDYPEDYCKTPEKDKWRFTKSCSLEGRVFLAMHGGNYMGVLDQNGLCFIKIRWDPFSEYNSVMKHKGYFDEKTFALNDYVKCIVDIQAED